MEKTSVCIIDYGMGNVRSVYNVFNALHCAVKVSGEPGDIKGATHIVLPGVGAFGAAVEKIKKMSSFEVLIEEVFKAKKPFLGICVGMQILADTGNEHGLFKGLGWVAGETKKINSNGLPLPHVGWNNFSTFKEDPIFRGVTGESDFYYVHSYAFFAKNKEEVIAACDYGEEFPSVIRKDNIYGVQFHPEKSQKTGLRLLENFLSIR